MTDSQQLRQATPPSPSRGESQPSPSREESQPSPSRGESQPSPSRSLDYQPPIKRHLYVEEVREMWNLVKVFRQLGTRELAVAFAEQRGLIPSTKICNHHKKPMRIEYSTNNTVGSFTCNRGPCRTKSKVSRGIGTWFENVKLTMPQIFYIMYAYASKWSYNVTIKEDFTDIKQCLSRATISNWYNNCRELVVVYQVDKQTFRGKIGGPGKIVQIGKSKFGKRKYNKGQRLEGQWVLGIIEDGSEDLRLEICPDNIRSVDDLVPLIQKHVSEGTIIHTDVWHAYDGLEKYGYTHKKVNNSDPEHRFVGTDGVHTQRIKSQCQVVKKFFSRDNYNHEKFSDLIYEYMWRRHITKNKLDPFEELISVILYTYNNNK